MKTEVAEESYVVSELKKYGITDVAINRLSDQYMSMSVDGPGDQENYKIVHQARIDIKGKRVDVEKKRKELKAESLAFGRAVDTEAKRITSLLCPIEDHLASQEKIVDDEKARIKEEKERLEKERIEKEEAERKRVEEENQAKIRAEQKVEFDRLERIRLKQEEKERKLQEEQNKIKADQAKIEAEKQAIEDQKRKEERDYQRKLEIEKAQKEAAERARIEAEQKAERDVEEKRLAEERAKNAETLRLALLPDLEKLSSLAVTIERISFPSLTHKRSYEILSNAKKHLVIACDILKGPTDGKIQKKD